MSDNFIGIVVDKPNISLLIEPDSLKQMEIIYKKAEKLGCTVTMKMEKMFWRAYFCSFADPFRIIWQMNFTPKM